MPVRGATERGEAVREPWHKSCSLSGVALLIPAWEPNRDFPSLVATLSSSGFGVVLIVDDGSGELYTEIFDEAMVSPRVEVLRHAANLGKGCALKTGFDHLLRAHPEVVAVVTADADGQHTPEDVERVACELVDPGAVRPVIGARRFGADVPFRSRLGNALTRRVFRLLTGTEVSDTQSGLRGLPCSVVPALLQLEGERYEYEMTMLAYLCRSGQQPVEVPIATVYLDENRESHFNPVWDSIRIYFALLRLIPGSRR